MTNYGRTVRQDAARSALLAGTGQGEDAENIDDEEKARLRKQSQDWLRADLAQWTELLEAGQPRDRAMVAPQMRLWQQHIDLAGIRDALKLAKLPADERMTWEKFWSAVAALLRRTALEAK